VNVGFHVLISLGNYYIEIMEISMPNCISVSLGAVNWRDKEITQKIV
jgi:hypothetical protein